MAAHRPEGPLPFGPDSVFAMVHPPSGAPATPALGIIGAEGVEGWVRQGL